MKSLFAVLVCVVLSSCAPVTPTPYTPQQERDFIDGMVEAQSDIQEAQKDPPSGVTMVVHKKPKEEDPGVRELRLEVSHLGGEVSTLRRELNEDGTMTGKFAKLAKDVFWLEVKPYLTRSIPVPSTNDPLIETAGWFILILLLLGFFAWSLYKMVKR